MKHNKTLKRIAASIALGALATSAMAHRQWILPSTSILSGDDQWISVEAAISNNLFYPNHHAMSLDGVKVLSPSGKQVEKQSTAEGKIRSSFELQLEEEGTYRIHSGRSGMFASWEENGERKRKRGSADDIAAMDLDSLENLSLREFISRVETIVTSGAPSELEPIGEGLEFEFLTHPNDLFQGETAEFKVLLDGEPLADHEITVVKGSDRFRNEAGDQKLTSDSEGVVSIDWDEPGRYWITSSVRLDGAEFKGFPLERGSSYTLTVEVLPE